MSRCGSRRAQPPALFVPQLSASTIVEPTYSWNLASIPPMEKRVIHPYQFVRAPKIHLHAPADGTQKSLAGKHRRPGKEQNATDPLSRLGRNFLSFSLSCERVSV